jgi:hypothetical protein
MRLLSPLGQQEVYSIPVHIKGAIKLPILACYFDVSLLHSPTVTNLVISLVHILSYCWRALKHPTLYRRMAYFGFAEKVN